MTRVETNDQAVQWCQECHAQVAFDDDGYVYIWRERKSQDVTKTVSMVAGVTLIDAVNNALAREEHNAKA